ncbi:polysaccharide deacetylase family protein [Catalinimonas niigatensis]|uniref:polysaccharide deacetylase family protein n=1 Tax=Catalinimonas niigatensis TaxID=1397264 RepID=UPI00266583FF|nr:polysaccharide deacetylase family protein [Catalinimonas niigatensis]WPP53604.1 polysaccharide deacetylase family protein [Catalinimonas niigatensis]
MYRLIFILSLFIFIGHAGFTQTPASSMQWPDGKRMALSLSFDDGRPSQVDVGTPLFNRYDAKVTFYLVPSAVEQRLSLWKQATADGHEMGNHSLKHPCSGNFLWARDKALEEYTLEQMREELQETNQQIEQMLRVTPTTFAYPCGQTYVGRGEQTQSYVPVVATLFTAGRGWLDEAPNDAAYSDMAQLTGMSMDAKDFDEIKPILEAAAVQGLWLVLAGHDIGEEGAQTTRTDMLETLIQYAQDQANGIWLAPVGEVAAFVLEKR